MIYHEIRDIDNHELSSTLSELPSSISFRGKEKENLTIGELRNIYREFSYGSVRLIATKDEPCANSTRIASRTADTYAEMILTIKKLRDENNSTYAILRHNLVTTHTKLQGEIGSIISESALIECKQHPDQITLVENAVRLDPRGSAEALLEITKRIVDLQAQIKGFEMLEGEIKLDMGTHNLKRVLLNILYPFYEEFNEANISVYIDIPDDIAEQYLVILDYQVFNIAMHHFFNNVIKYTRPYSKVIISFAEQLGIVKFSMRSVRIDRDEISNIFKLMVSGKNAGKLAGDGIGMYMVQKALSLLKSRMEIIPNHSDSEKMGETNYTKNEFLIYLNKDVI